MGNCHVITALRFTWLVSNAHTVVIKQELRATFCKNATKLSNLIFDPLRLLLVFSHNICISEKLKDLKAQLDKSYTFRVMDPSSLP